MITAAAGVIGLFGSRGNIAAAGILAVAALAFMTFWRNVWISWAMPSATSRKNPADDLGKTEERVESDRYQAVVGGIILLILLAIVRGCGKDIIRAIF